MAMIPNKDVKFKNCLIIIKIDDEIIKIENYQE